jgi:hypothetical protein
LPDPVDPEVASDSIDELLAVTVPRGVSDNKPLPGRVHIHCMDTEGEWFIQPNGNVERIHAKGDVALRGTASGRSARRPTCTGISDGIATSRA